MTSTGCTNQYSRMSLISINIFAQWQNATLNEEAGLDVERDKIQI